MTHPTPTDDAQLRRRGLLRGGALAAVAAGAVVAGTARPAAAANGGNVVIGQLNEGTVTTTLKNPTPATTRNTVPPLTLLNANGPALQLQPLGADWSGQLGIGQVVGTTDGPLVGVDAGDGTTGVTDYLATGLDLALLPVPIPNDPRRLLDTRTSSGRARIIAKSSGALSSTGQLVKGAWIDVSVPVDDLDTSPIAAFVNLTAVLPTGGGYLAVYPGPTKPPTSTLNFTKSVTIANGAFVSVREDSGVFSVRIYASATTHVLLDLSGSVLIAVPSDGVTPSSTARGRSQARAARKRRAALRRSR